MSKRFLRTGRYGESVIIGSREPDRTVLITPLIDMIAGAFNNNNLLVLSQEPELDLDLRTTGCEGIPVIPEKFAIVYIETFQSFFCNS